MPIMKAYDLAYGRLRSPDLDKQEEFLTDFGMVRADRTKNALYMRGTDAPHHIHVTELGEPRYVGIAVHAASLEDLDRVSRVDGASKIEDIDEPGGGKRVRLTDPDGYQVEVVYGLEMLDPIPVKRPAVNSGNEKYRRKGELFRVDPGPSHIKRFGHFVIMTTNFEKLWGGIARPSASGARTSSMPARRATSSAHLTGSTVAKTMSTITPSSAFGATRRG